MDLPVHDRPERRRERHRPGGRRVAADHLDPELTPRRGVGVAAAALLVLVWASTSPTLGAWTRGVVQNSDVSAAVASLVLTHSAGLCTQGPRISTPASSPLTCAGSLFGTRTITNTGTARAAQLTASVKGESCATVKLDNRARASDVMLPRYGTRFLQPGPWGGANALSLDGTAYAAAVESQTSTSANNARYGYGIWFRAGVGQGGTLFGFDASPTDTATAGSDDRQLTMGADGRLTFTVLRGLGLLQPAPAVTSARFDDGTWHFAYVTMAVAGLALTTTIHVDGQQVAQQQALNATLIQFITTTGYWHLGWGPLTASYFTGSLSSFTVFAAGNAPAGPVPNPASQAAHDTFAANASEHWRLDDPGTTTYPGSQPVLGTTSPCGSVTLTWTFTTPSSTALNGVSAATFAAGATYPVPAVPGPGQVQGSSLVATRVASANAYVAGLRLLLPITYTAQFAGGTWPLSSRWASAESALVVP